MYYIFTLLSSGSVLLGFLGLATLFLVFRPMLLLTNPATVREFTSRATRHGLSPGDATVPTTAFLATSISK
jgi:hypothetical protein